MSTATIPTAPEETGSRRRQKGSLFAAEMQRLAARRLVRLLVLLALAAFATGVVLTMVNTAKPDPAATERARTQYAEQHQQCLREPSIPEADKQGACGPAELPPEQLQYYLDKSPFTLASELPNGANGVGGATAVLLFLIGATAIGAEWSSRSIVALLFWEPRRLKVMAVKLAVTALAAAAIAAVAQALWLGAANVLARTNGTTGPLPPQFWPDTLAAQGRLIVVGVLTALLGFGIANLIRNTGAALGVGFVYFAILENVVRAVRPRWGQWLFTENIAAFAQRGGLDYRTYGGERVMPDGSIMSIENVVHLSNLRGFVILACYTGIVLAVGVIAFRRRDLT